MRPVRLSLYVAAIVLLLCSASSAQEESLEAPEWVLDQSGPFVSVSMADFEPRNISDPFRDISMGEIPNPISLLSRDRRRINAGWRFNKHFAVEATVNVHRNNRRTKNKLDDKDFASMTIFRSQPRYESSARTVLVGGRIIVPIRKYVDLYGGALIGRYSMENRLEFERPASVSETGQHPWTARLLEWQEMEERGLMDTPFWALSEDQIEYIRNMRPDEKISSVIPYSGIASQVKFGISLHFLLQVGIEVQMTNYGHHGARTSVVTTYGVEF